MITLLVDHNIEGQAALLHSTLISESWTELTAIRFVTFGQLKLPFDSTDRTVWEFAQTNHFLLLTGNRNMHGSDSLERTIREQNHATALPVITIANIDRMVEQTYRQQCAVKIALIVLYFDDFLGTGRIFIP